MLSFDIYYTYPSKAIVSPLQVRRDWMDEMPYQHVYKCFPMTLANNYGYGISFPSDISFIWDGNLSGSRNHVKIIEGQQYAYTDRGYATISFFTGIRIKTDQNVSMIAYPVPNQFIDGYQAFTSIISTSFFKSEFQLAGKITRPNQLITIKAGTPVAAIMPISLTEINNSEAIVKPFSELSTEDFLPTEYFQTMANSNRANEVTNFYRDATDHLGNKLGEHEVKAIRLNYKDTTYLSKN